LEQRHEKRQKRCCDQRKFDDSGAFIASQRFAAGKAVADLAYDARQPLHERRRCGFVLFNTHSIADGSALLDLSGDAVKKRLRATVDFSSSLSKTSTAISILPKRSF
jgi:hypothetical protein